MTNKQLAIEIINRLAEIEYHHEAAIRETDEIDIEMENAVEHLLNTHSFKARVLERLSREIYLRSKEAINITTATQVETFLLNYLEHEIRKMEE